MFSVVLHQLYPGDYCRNALHPDSFGSDLNGHVLWNVPDLPYGKLDDDVGARGAGVLEHAMVCALAALAKPSTRGLPLSRSSA